MSPGPVPNRSEDLSRERDARRGNRPDISKAEMLPVEIPDTPQYWDPMAQEMFESFKLSGQQVFWQQSDWQFAFFCCEEISKYAMNPNPKAFHLQQILAMLSSLMVTEADRRRARIELQQPKPVAEPVHISVVRDAMESILDD